MHTVRQALVAIFVLLFAGVASGANGAGEAGHWRPIEVLRFSPDGTLLASGGHDGRVMLWRMPSGEHLRTLAGHRLLVSDLAFGPDGQVLASASWDGTARVWDVAGGEPLQVIAGHDDQIRSVAVSPDGTRIATGANDKTVRLWNAGDGTEIARGSTGIPRANALAFSPDGGTLYVGTGMKTVEVRTAQTLERTALHEIDASAHRLVPLGEGAILVGHGAGVARFSAADGKLGGRLLEGRLTGAFDCTADRDLFLAPGRRGVVIQPKNGEVRIVRPKKKRSIVAVAIAPDGSVAAGGLRSGGIELFDPATGEAVASIAPGAAPYPELADPDGPVAAFFGRDLTRQEARRWWTARDDTGALEWLGDAGSLRFEAAATPQHNVGRDWLHIETGLGEEPFDLTFEVRLDKVMGPGVFYCGLAVGMAESPPGRMEADDVTAVVALHLDKAYAGVHRGEVYALDARYGNLASRGITRPAEDGTYRPEHNWSREARALFSTDRPLRLRMRREGPDRIAFAAWRPGAGQTPAAPWWRGTCTIPQKYAGRPLEHLIVKRIPISGVHLGQQAVGYGEILGMAGRLTELVLRQAPPVVDAVTWDPAALTPGDSFVIRGRGFPQEPMVRVGGTDAEVVARAEDRLEVRLPELEPGRRYAVTVSGPDGVDANEVDAVAVGRFLEEMSLLQAPPAGGRVATLQGAGFTEGTEVRVGGAKAEVVEVVSREAIRVRIPAGKPGRATVSARDGRDAFAGELAFAYASHPRLRFSREELAALKEKVKSPVFAPYLQRLEAIAAATLEKTPRGGRRAGGLVEAVAWHYALTGDEADRDWLRKALPAIAQTRPLGGWSGDTVSGVAFGYDLVAAELDAEAAGAVQQYLRAAVDHFRDASARNEWFHTNISSTNPLSNAAGISAVLVLGDVLADRDELLGAAKEHLLRYIRGSFGPDGGAIEGMGRGMEGLTDYLHAAHLLARHTGDRTLIDHPRVDAVADLFRTVVAAKDGILRFRKVYGGLQGLAPLADQERRTGDPLFRTLADAAAKDAGGSRAMALGLAMMWRSTEAAPADPPAIPALSVLDRIEWASVRSRPRLDAGLVLGVKGGDGPQPYHQQHDVGSFTLFAGGEELLLDPGWGQTRGDQHNALVVDGTGPDVAGGTITDAWEGEDLRAVVLDATAAYRPWGIRRVRRSFVMAGDDAVVVLDDVLPATDGAGRVETFFQTAEAKRPDDGDALVVEGEAGTLRIELHGGPAVPLEWSKEERKQRHRKSTWLTHAAGYTADPAAPLVTLVRYIRDGADRTPDAASVVRDDDQTVVTLGGRQIVFRRTPSGWAFLPPAGEGEARTPLLTPAPDRTPPQATAVRTDTPPRLDGDLDDAVWQRAESIGPLAPEEAWDFERESAHPTETRFAWDDEALYVALRCFEPDLASLEGGIEGPAQPVSGEDRIYLYLDPGRQREGNNFFGATILASGLDLGIYGKQGDIGLPLRHLHVGRELEAPTAWTVEIAIPWADLFHDPWETLPRLRPESGLRVGLNVLRHYTARPAEVSVWARSYPWAVAAPHRWGTLVLE